MGQIYDSIKGLITPARLSTGAGTLNMDVQQLSKGVSHILPAMLGLLAQRGASDRVADAVNLGGQLKLASDLDNVWKGNGIIDSVNVGERMENALLEHEKPAFISGVAKAADMDENKVDRLSNWVCGTIAGWFGNRVVADKANLPHLIGDLKAEAGDFTGDIPAGLAAALGLAHHNAAPHERIEFTPARAISDPGHAATTSDKAVPPREKREKKCGLGWLWWWLGLLLLALVICLCVRSCNTKKAAKVEAPVENIAPPAPEAPKVDHRVATTYTLPDGTVIEIFENGTADQMLRYLESDEYRKASPEDFKKIWFRFDDVGFKHDSATEFVDGGGSNRQLDNIARILVNHPSARIMIAGYADKTGGVPANIEISRERAEFIKAYLTGKGVDAGRVSTEGFGKEFAVYPADAPDELRAHDRDIALRFNK